MGKKGFVCQCQKCQGKRTFQSRNTIKEHMRRFGVIDTVSIDASIDSKNDAQSERQSDAKIDTKNDINIVKKINLKGEFNSMVEEMKPVKEEKVQGTEYKCGGCGHEWVSRVKPKRCPNCPASFE